MWCFLRLLCTGFVSLLQWPDRPVCAQFALEVLNSYPMRCSVYARFASSRLCDFSSGQGLRQSSALPWHRPVLLCLRGWQLPCLHGKCGCALSATCSVGLAPWGTGCSLCAARFKSQGRSCIPGISDATSSSVPCARTGLTPLSSMRSCARELLH